ncbi:hypothetical protein [Halopseudomonas yangmingensis]|uniref:SH3 domain protein n=1 Tax=Halopseudomonas yangmingensis TaxID=1720063 RepID=A0A1I4S5T3_9GAMM|nr:hypothetical protein [Halopseudomonas yangmingensis]SFM59809.1 hypothetical protein SAMN05216217_10914 [Halopseudomonas yangmingensis]
MRTPLTTLLLALWISTGALPASADPLADSENVQDTAVLQAELAELEAERARLENALQQARSQARDNPLSEENLLLQDRLQQQQAIIDAMRARDQQQQQQWFLIGGGTVAGSLLLGFMLGRSGGGRRKSSEWLN